MSSYQISEKSSICEIRESRLHAFFETVIGADSMHIKKGDHHITVTMTSRCGDPDDLFEVDDVIEVYEYGLESNDFDLSNADQEEWQKFLIAEGISPLIKNNQWLEKINNLTKKG